MTTFNNALRVFESKDAVAYAGALFQESFNSAFPVPVAYPILESQIQLQDWHQFVAVYTWPDGSEECVGFCNWIRYEEVCLEGGLSVRKSFYRRLPKTLFAECSARGGFAQIVMETAATQLTDSDAWFGSDHVVFREDLLLLNAFDLRITSALEVARPVAEPTANWPENCVAITFDDGTNFDLEDLPHPSAGDTRCMLNVMRDAT